MSGRPISPAPVTGVGDDLLPAYLSNGVVGLRVREIPLMTGVAVLNGLAGEHPVDHVECTPHAPYPLSGDLRVGRVRLSDFLLCVRDVEQRYDFGSGELTSRFVFVTPEATAEVEVTTFCSRTHPAIVAQRVQLIVDAACDVELSAKLDPRPVPGRWLERHVDVPGGDDAPVDGALHWETLGGFGRCGVAYSTACDADGERSTATWDKESPLVTSYSFRARRGRRYEMVQLAAMVPSDAHDQPHLQAIRLVAHAARVGFDRLRDENRRAWDVLWEGRVEILGGSERWQGLVDAAFFYLNTSVHSSSLASTHVFGLAQWHDYHYYYGHVMWDIEAFLVPPLLLTQPHACAAMLDYRFRVLGAARQNARLNGRRGLQFPWQSSPRFGQESAPGGGDAAAYEDHISPNVALAFARYFNATGDVTFDRERVWPVLSGVSEWIESRVTRTARGYEILAATGIAERKAVHDNSAYVNLMCKLTLREALACAARNQLPAPQVWGDIADQLVVPMYTDRAVVQDHDGFRRDEEKGATPAVLAAMFPGGWHPEGSIEEATTRFYLDLADEYVGSPMLSALYPTWACRIGEPKLAAELLEEGYAKFTSTRFMNVHEYRPDRFPDEPVSGPFMANLSGMLLNCYYGFTGIEPGPDDPSTTWARRPVSMPEGWEGIHVDSVCVRHGTVELTAMHGERARLEGH